MKKRILALLLAGLITASMASCVSSGDQNDGETTTDPNATTVATTTGSTAPQDQFTVVDETVYTLINASLLTDINATTAAVVAPQLTELRRVEYNATWSKVEYNGVKYYVVTSALTADDIKGKNFTPTDTVMYAKETVNVRPYAVVNTSFSAAVAQLEQNETVKVIGTGFVGGRSWSKIEYTDATGVHTYFVASDYLSATPVQPDTPVDYSPYFTECAPTTMYIKESMVTVRTTPVVPGENEENYNYAATLTKNVEVTVLKVGKDQFASWSWIEYALPTKPGDAQLFGKGYIKSALLSAVQSGQAASLDSLISAYGFEKVEPSQTMYVANNVNSTLFVRGEPVFTSDADNKIGSVSTKQPVTVVAKGTYGNTFAYIIVFEDGYGFVSGTYITSDPNGAPMVTLEALCAKYGFEALDTAKDYYVTSDVNCRLVPGNEADVAKTLTTGEKVSVVASGAYSSALYYILDIEGIYYFAGASFFTDSAPQG